MVVEEVRRAKVLLTVLYIDLLPPLSSNDLLPDGGCGHQLRYGSEVSLLRAGISSPL
jgi:hypothetical protein